MKDGLKFVDCDMHIMEPPDLFDRYLDPRQLHEGRRRRGKAQRRPMMTAAERSGPATVISGHEGRRR